MKDGTKRDITSSQLISLMRERGRGQFSSRTPAHMLNSGIASLMTIDGVENVTVKDVWGRDQENPFELRRNKKGKAVNYFQVEPGVTLGDAIKADRRGKGKGTRLDKMEDEHATLEERVAELLAKPDLTHDENVELDKAQARMDELVDNIEAEIDQLASARRIAYTPRRRTVRRTYSIPAAGFNPSIYRDPPRHVLGAPFGSALGG
jgi:hypothetical protein